MGQQTHSRECEIGRASVWAKGLIVAEKGQQKHSHEFQDVVGYSSYWRQSRTKIIGG